MALLRTLWGALIFILRNAEFKKPISWLITNRLSLNIVKTEFMV